MSFSLEAAADIYRHATRWRCISPKRRESTVALLEESKIFAVNDFSYGEAVVHFGKRAILGPKTRLRVGPACCGPRGFKGNQVRVIRITPRNESAGLKPDFDARDGAGRRLTSQPHGARAIADRATVVDRERARHDTSLHCLLAGN